MENNRINGFLACPDCGHGLSAGSAVECTCHRCGRIFLRHNGIWELLPSDETNLSEDERNQRDYYDGSAAELIDRRRRRFESLHYQKVAGILEAVESLVDGTRSMNVCEIGVGSALHASWFLEKIAAARFFGVDISAGSLESGRSRWERLDGFVPVQGSAYTLPFESGAFDLVYFSGTLHHCQQPGEAIGEAARILRKGGILVISEPVWYYPANLYFNLRVPEEAGQRLLKRKKVEKWCIDSGLTLQSFSCFNHLPYPRRAERLALLLEKILSGIPLLRLFGSMFRCIARK